MVDAGQPQQQQQRILRSFFGLWIGIKKHSRNVLLPALNTPCSSHLVCVSTSEKGALEGVWRWHWHFYNICRHHDIGWKSRNVLCCCLNPYSEKAGCCLAGYRHRREKGDRPYPFLCFLDARNLEPKGWWYQAPMEADRDTCATSDTMGTEGFESALASA